MEGDAAVNRLFQKIYADSSDEVKKAMLKSFVSKFFYFPLLYPLNPFFFRFFQTESKGTVLSTNWDEVGKEKVDCKPPDGMEFKKWD